VLLVRAFTALALVALTFAAYGGVPELGFVFDDRSYVVMNPHVTGGLTAANVSWAWTTGHVSNWHPLTWMSLMLDAQLFGPGPRGFHLTNLVLHAANVLLLVSLLVRMTGTWWKSVLVSALFAVHPQHVESVAWVAERKDVLSTFFGLLALGAYVRYAESSDREQRGGAWYALSLLAFAASLASKQMLVTLPFLLLLLDVWPLDRARVKLRLLEKLPFLALSVAASWVVLFVQRVGGATAMLEPQALTVRVANAAIAYGMYLLRAVWPTKLAALYPHPGDDVSFLAAGAAMAVLAAVTAVVLVARKARPYLAVGWFWYLGTLVPVIGLVQIGVQQRADRYTYVPLIGVYVAVVWGLGAFVSRRGRGVALAMSVVVLSVLTVVARRQVEVWHDDATLFRHALRVTENNALAHNNLGAELLDRGQVREAEEHLHAALALDPGHVEANYNLGNALLARGLDREAEAGYRAALQLDPNHVQSRANLGLVLVQQERFAEGIHELRAAVRLAPDDPKALTTLANSLARVGKLGEAYTYYDTALALDPAAATIHFNYGNALLRGGHNVEALARFEEAVRLDPRFAPAREALRQLRGE